MLKEQINTWIGVIANIGVIAGIIFLAIELRQTNDLMNSEARANRMEQTIALELYSAENADKYANFTSIENLTPEQTVWFNSTFRAMILLSEWTYLELPESELPLDRWRRSYNQNEMMKYVWNENRSDWDQSFVDYFEKNIFQD